MLFCENGGWSAHGAGGEAAAGSDDEAAAAAKPGGLIMNIEIGTRIWFGAAEEPKEVVNIRLQSAGQLPQVYFDDGGDMDSAQVYYNARRWA